VGKRLQFRSSVPGVTEPVLGLIGATAIHLQDRTGEPKVRKMHELFVDIGAKDEAEARAKLNVGDPGTFLDGSMMLGEHLIVARALDNRIGTWVAAETLRLCAAQAERRVRVVAVSTVQEEVGLHGATMVADSLRPDVALVTDVGHATDSPGITHAQHGQFKVGHGPKVAIGGTAVDPGAARRDAGLERHGHRLDLPGGWGHSLGARQLPDPLHAHHRRDGRPARSRADPAGVRGLLRGADGRRAVRAGALSRARGRERYPRPER
jgi:hypothetical protein